METGISELINQLIRTNENDAYKASDRLAEIDSNEVLNSLVELLAHPNAETKYLAARTLGKIKNNAAALEPLLEAIQDDANKQIAGDLLTELEGYNLSDHYVTLFKLYLFGSFKVSMIAKEYLDYKEFTITSRVIRKAHKHWNHYMNNIKHDEVFALRKQEVEEMLKDLTEYVSQSVD